MELSKHAILAGQLWCEYEYVAEGRKTACAELFQSVKVIQVNQLEQVKIGGIELRDEFQLITPRLVIREVKMDDDVQILSAMLCPEIDSMHSSGFKNTSDVDRYISVLIKEYENNKFRTLAIAEKLSNQLIGTITIDIHKFLSRAELGYWISIPYRNKGYATEAVKAVIEYGIRILNLCRIQATHHINNPASGRVLEKAGMVLEGTLRGYYEMNGVSIDEKMYSTIRSDILRCDLT